MKRGSRYIPPTWREAAGVAYRLAKEAQAARLGLPVCPCGRRCIQCAGYEPDRVVRGKLYLWAPLPANSDVQHASE